jgi:hypothetical protein
MKDITTKYRIKKVTKWDKVTFRAQRKYLWWWINLGDYDYSQYESVVWDIHNDIQERAKTMIEYLDVTLDELAPRTPNPPVDAL